MGHSDRERGVEVVRRCLDDLTTAMRSNRPVSVGAADVHYDVVGGATAGLVVCDELTFSAARSEHVVRIDRVAPYEPGSLFKRELPCIESVLASSPSLDLLIVDGYATLDPSGRAGLGAHAAARLGIPVIGVAKTPFRTATHAVEVIRGTAVRPLYVTEAGGLGPVLAARIIAQMHGENRIPSALRRVDRLARGLVDPSPDPPGDEADG